MKLKFLYTLCMAAVGFSAAAQTHVEGEEYYKADQIANAKELLNRNMNNAGTDKSIANYYLGQIAMEEGNLAEAKSYFDKGVSANPNYAYNYVGLGAIALKQNDAKTAQNNFKTAEGKVKKDTPLYIAIARAYYNANPVAYGKQIDSYYQKARKANDKSPEIYIFDGDRAKDRKEIGDAGAKYEMAIGYANNESAPYVKYANLFTLVNPQYAIEKLQELLSKNPTSALAQREIANAYYNNKDYKNAVAQYAKYVNNPNHFKQDEDRYAFLLFFNGDYQDGYNYATKLLNANPTNFTAQRYQFMNAAQLPAMKEQLLPLAQKLYDAHKANPDNKFAPIDYTLIAEEFGNGGEPELGITVLKEAIAEMPENASFNKTLAMVYVDKNELANAADAYHGYLEKSEDPGYNDFVQQALFSYFAGIEKKDDSTLSKKYYNDAIEYSKKASAIDDTQYKPYKMMGDIAKQTATESELSSAAVPMYTSAIERLEKKDDTSRYASDAKDMYNYMGNYYLDKKDVTKAKEYFNKYLKYDPNNEAYRKFVEGL